MNKIMTTILVAALGVAGLTGCSSTPPDRSPATLDYNDPTTLGAELVNRFNVNGEDKDLGIAQSATCIPSVAHTFECSVSVYSTNTLKTTSVNVAFVVSEDGQSFVSKAN